MNDKKSNNNDIAMSVMDIDQDDMVDNDNQYVYTLRSNIAQIVATLGFCILLVALGLIFCMPTIVIGGLLGVKEGFSIDEDSASWFGSIVFLTQPMGSFISGFLQDKFGRKKCMMSATIPQFVGWILLYYSTSVTQMYTASTLMGLSIGFIEAPILSYIGEITEPRMRGPMSVLGGSFASIGVLLECLFGALTDWRNVCAISSCFPIMAFIALSFIPESPVWLICTGRIAEAEQALCWLRGWVHPAYVRQEFLTMLSNMNSPYAQEMADISKENRNRPMEDFGKKQKTKLTYGLIENIRILSHPKIYRPFIMVFIYFIIAHTISLMGMKPFLVNIFQDMGMPISSHWVLVISSGLQVIGSVLCILTMHKFGKRLITFMSLSVSVVSCFLLGIFLMKETQHAWITFSLFCLIFFATGFGVCPIPWVLLSEIYPVEGRGIAGGVSAASSYFILFVVTKSYINFAHLFDVYGTCFIYSAVGLMGFVYLYIKLPETEGKTLKEIEEFFKDKPSKPTKLKSSEIL